MVTRKDIISTVMLGIICAALAAVVVVGTVAARRASVEISAQNTKYRIACVYSGGQMHGLDCIR